jgi:hypothetical protein
VHFKKKIRNKVYGLYLKGVSLEFISVDTKLDINEVNEIINYMNEIFN